VNILKIFFLFLLLLVCETIGAAATPGLLCQPRVIVKMTVEKQMECRLAGATEGHGENLPQHHFCYTVQIRNYYLRHKISVHESKAKLRLCVQYTNIAIDGKIVTN
jgi:hypothetical protein